MYPGGTYLWYEDKAEGTGGAEDDEYGYDDVGGVLVVTEYVGDRNSYHAHDHHIVDTHADVLTVIQGRDVDCTSLPGEETTEHLVGMPNVIL